MAKINETKAADQLIDLYQIAFNTINTKLTNKIKRGQFTGYDVALLEDINKTINQLVANTNGFNKQALPDIYNQSRLETIDFFKKHTTREFNPDFATIHNDAIAILQNNLNNSLNVDVNQRLGRQVDDLFRKAQLKQAQMLSTGAVTIDENIEAMTKVFAKQNIFEFVDKAGRVWNLDTYMRSAIRTTVTASVNSATINQNIEYDNDLVELSWHSTSCPVCAPYQGRVYSISGNTKGYPALSEINEGAITTYGVVHPNCRHRLIPYIPELDEDAEEHKKFSNTKFVDTRTEYSRERYKARQNTNVWNREINELTEQRQLLKNLPDKTPKQLAEIESLNQKIKSRKGKVEELKKWQLDKPSASDLFTELPPSIKKLNS